MPAPPQPALPPSFPSSLPAGGLGGGGPASSPAPAARRPGGIRGEEEEEAGAQSGGCAEREGARGAVGPSRPKGALASGPRPRRRSLAPRGPASRGLGGRGKQGHGGERGGGEVRSELLERRGRGGAKLARRPGTSAAAWAMGEHPSPGPAVAACAEAERIEELEPEAEERLPAAPEDVSAPFCAPQTFWGAPRGDQPRPQLPTLGGTWRIQGYVTGASGISWGPPRVGGMGLPK